MEKFFDGELIKMTSYNDSKVVPQLAHVIKVNGFSFTPIHQFAPRKADWKHQDATPFIMNEVIKPAPKPITPPTPVPPTPKPLPTTTTPTPNGSENLLAAPTYTFTPTSDNKNPISKNPPKTNPNIPNTGGILYDAKGNRLNL